MTALSLAATPASVRPVMPTAGAAAAMPGVAVLQTQTTWVPSEAEIIEARNGDPDALETIYKTGMPRLLAFYRFQGLGAADAEDLASDAMEAVLRNVAKLRAPKAFEAWFWTIGRRQFARWLRNKKTVYEPVIAAAPPPDEMVALFEDHAHIRTALLQLAPKDRELLWLREVEELSYEEIGGRLGAAIGTARVATHRARQRLADAYAEVAR